MNDWIAKWEEINSVHLGYTERMRVPGGWLVRVFSEEVKHFSVCFFPDPTYSWNLEE